jgi:hypothetical protein
VAFFVDLISDIDQSFKDVLPKHFCVPCFVKGVLEGVAVGALAVAGLAALAAAAPLAATVTGVALAVIGIAGVVRLVSSWKGMSDQQKSEALGGLLGGAITGRFAGGTAVGVPSLELGAVPRGAATLELAVAGATISTPAATAAGAGIGAGAAMMMSSGGPDRGGPPEDAEQDATDKGTPAQPKFGSHKSAEKWQKQMEARGWTPDQIQEAISNGKQYPAANNVNPGNTATRYVNPTTGQSVVVDDQTGEILHVGGPGFKY